MKKRIFTLLFIIAFISIGPLMINADTPTGILLYSDEIVENLELIWDVNVLDASGEFDVYGDDFYVDNLNMATGHEIKLRVTADPDTTNDSWFDLYVNDIKATDETNTSVAMGTIFMYDPSAYFISPIQYENATDIYDLYEQLFEDYEKTFLVQEIHITQFYSTQNQELRIYGTYDGNKISMGQFMSIETHQNNPDGSEQYMRQVIDISWTRDVQTGILQENLVYYDFETYSKAANGTILIQQEGRLDFSLTLRIDESPFSWVYSLIGLFALATVPFLIRKKRKH